MATIRRRKDGGYLITLAWKGKKYDKQIALLRQVEATGDATALIMERLLNTSPTSPEQISDHIQPTSDSGGLNEETKRKLKGRFSV